MKRKQELYSTDNKANIKKVKRVGENYFIQDRIIVAKNVLSDREQIHLYNKCIDYNIKKSKKYTTTQNISEMPNSVDHYVQWLSEEIPKDQYDDDYRLRNIYTNLMDIFRDILYQINIKYPKKNWTKGLEKIFKDTAQAIMCLSYPRSGYLQAHYDKWSDWNIMVSIGGSSEFIYPRGKIQLDSGDVIIFNGNHKFHKVELLDSCTNSLWKKNSFGFHRCCIQLRKYVNP